MKKQLKPYTKADYHVTREENKREKVLQKQTLNN